MDLRLSDEQEMIRDAARDFAQSEIMPVAEHYDQTGEFPLPIIQKMGGMGFMGIETPEAYGGAGLDTIAYVLAMEEIAKADVATSTIMSVNNSLYSHGILSFGTEEQKHAWVTPIATRPGNRRLRADRADVGVGCRGDEYAGRTQRRWLALCDQWAQIVDHFRPGGASSGLVRQDRPRGSARISGHLRLSDRHPPARFLHRQNRTQAGHPRLGHLRDHVR